MKPLHDKLQDFKDAIETAESQMEGAQNALSDARLEVEEIIDKPVSITERIREIAETLPRLADGVHDTESFGHEIRQAGTRLAAIAEELGGVK